MGDYRVHRGDTLSRIASTAGITLSELMAANCITNANMIRVGEPVRPG
ncbi:MAG: LysM peptidoglycan-binding domain-containing protein [Chloroflexi bacterium]|nr:LysM peptidoglycan-binding domain-containing protein [Chloroflexota bacterium]